MGKSRKTSTSEWCSLGNIENIKFCSILLKYPPNHFHHLHIYSIFSLWSQSFFPSYGFMFILIFWFLFLKNIYFSFLSFSFTATNLGGTFFFFFPSSGIQGSKISFTATDLGGTFFLFFFFLLVGSRDPKFPSTNLQFLFPSYFCSLFPCEHREPHQSGSYPLTFAIVAHPWNLIYGGALVVEIWTSLICLQRASFRPSQTRRSWPLSRHFAGSSFIPFISSLIHTQKVFSFRSNCSYFVKECDFFVCWEDWNCCLFWFEIFSFRGKRERRLNWF